MISRPRLEFAALAFLAEMRRQWVIAQPDDPCPIKMLAEYPEGQRSALMAAVSRAISSSRPEADKTFETWLAKKNTSTQT